MTVHTFGATSSPSCASLALKHAIKDNLDVEDQFTAEMLQSAFYVDDCLMNVSTVKEMQAVALLLKSILLKGGFRLTKFYNRVIDAVTDIPTEDLSSATINLDRQQTEVRKTLGFI
ncbi:RT pepA17: Reverse transcriptase (RTs) in retrotransposons domain-containing protein [Paragonimus skrjabini miyazakii]|uniref:RT pepA17: Reverse transcriptase (RTs) in retrotransposons domain-containing protein n=1 Tax=Paragonimus skrjabini miyazakii TaxID=59628 RepID=A0A8S9YMJ6_9TREM|nr:RT pepA17: Reverse transcriptase (RTs) in retrotransposons domain-containing protein [Paragonimus skrjabini miyazakii]